MKTITNYLLLLSVLISACGTNDQKNPVNYEEPFQSKVLTIRSGELTATTKKDFLANWEKQVFETQNIKLRFEKPIIKQQDNGTLIMVATSTDGLTKMATVVSIIKNGEIKAEGSTCMCTGCSQGCDPEHISGNKWKCTDCIGQTHTTCTKSVTATPGKDL